MMVDRFAMKNAGIDKPFAKTNRLPYCCCRRHPEGPFFVGLALARTAPTDWKAAINDLWADEYEALLIEQAARARQEEAAHRQRLLDEHAVRARQQEEAARQEAARAAQHLLHERTALEQRQGEAARRQRLLDEQSARRQRVAQARQTAAARVIFLWLRRRRLFARLARQTSRRLQHEVALARMQHEQECCMRAMQVMEQRRQAAAAQAKAIADEATERHQAARRQQLLDEHATRACQQKAAALRQRLRLLSESVAERQRSAELAAQQKQAAARTIWCHL